MEGESVGAVEEVIRESDVALQIWQDAEVAQCALLSSDGKDALLGGEA